ncbi:hypothetical protein B9057_02050 [Aestuarium zhoushanense]|nr:hypothetical protein B9057_02050 [Aestuarium zhoushanense]
MTQNVLINSLPKSGTHLLEKTLMVLGGAARENGRTVLERAADKIGLTPPPFLDRRTAGRWGRLRGYGNREQSVHPTDVPVGVFSPYFVPRSVFESWLRNRPLTSFGKAHVPFSQSAMQAFDATQTRAITILRDPRAVAASMIPYVLNARNWNHYLRPFYETLTEDERVDFTIHGGYANPPGLAVKSLNDALESVLNWGQHDGTLIIKFEDLVGPQGGGTADAQFACVQAIAAHLNVPMTDDLWAKVSQVFDPSSPTFRGGRIDAWRDRLTPSQIARVEASLDPALMQRAGYDD